MGRHKSNGAGTYKGKLYYKEEELKEQFDLIFGCMDKVEHKRTISDAPSRGIIDIIIERRQGNG